MVYSFPTMEYMVTGNAHFMKHHFSMTKYLGVICAFSAVLSMPTEAHAGWFNDMFVFREEQASRVAPNNVDLPPVEVISPYYNQREAAQWSHHHTRQNMEPVPYIDGSSSLVMRQQAPKGDTRRMKAWPGNLKAKPNDTAALPQGYEAILWRDYLNRSKADSKDTLIGEPGMMQRVDNAGLGRSIGQKTIIGEPVRSWKDGPAPRGTGIEARPGDFDYNTEARNHYTQPQGSTTIISDAPERLSPVKTPAMDPYAGDKPNRYIVQQDDTLSGISEKDKIYGNWKMWPLIYDANRNQIKDPDLIHPKQDLGIPRDYTRQESADAQQRALDKQPPYSFYDGK